MFETIYVEKDLHQWPRTQEILNKYPNVPVKIIDNYEQIFGKYHRPYLYKRRHLQLFLAKKRGALVREAPPAYGQSNREHFYFLHAYNCIYECQYCYLQGHFSSPDIVMFLNWEDIGEKIRELSHTHPGAWFHAGEFSDSLALNNLINEWPFYWNLFSQLDAFLELRTKSNKIEKILELPPLPNVAITFSLSTQESIRLLDKKTPSLGKRLESMSQLAKKGHKLGIHFDPIVPFLNIEVDLKDLVAQVFSSVPIESVTLISLGVVRFPQNTFQQVEKNYPDSMLLTQEYIRGSDGKIRIPKPLRLGIINKLRNYLLDAGVPANVIYTCMENDSNS